MTACDVMRRVLERRLGRLASLVVEANAAESPVLAGDRAHVV
jgi:hypothetical protein